MGEASPCPPHHQLFLTVLPLSDSRPQTLGKETHTLTPRRLPSRLTESGGQTVAGVGEGTRAGFQRA